MNIWFSLYVHKTVVCLKVWEIYVTVLLVLYLSEYLAMHSGYPSLTTAEILIPKNFLIGQQI